MPRTDEGYEWSPGHTVVKADGAQPSLLLIYDGRGIYCGMLRVGKTTLQFCRQEPSEPKVTRQWRDATELWVRFPTWLRREATDALMLHPVF